MNVRYCESPFFYHRRVTREITVGDPAHGGFIMGGNHPVVRQSMLTCDTMDTALSVRQTLELVAVGCQLVRITAPTVKDAANLQNIVAELRAQKCFVPIVADIHFKPDAAMEAVKWVEVVRVNPGNYADSKKFATKEYTDEQYAEELKRIEEKFTPLVLEAKKLKRCLRIGTNHGSLSDRIMNRFGDTPLGMVESALEFAKIARKNDFHNFKFSMKSSNPKVMIECYRLLVARLNKEGADWNYPIHLGVTEAGEGEDGRIKSAIGIGSLLCDGLGDTIRVSLTEDSPREIEVCRDLLAQIPILSVAADVRRLHSKSDKSQSLLTSAATEASWNLRQQITAHFNLARGIFRERNADGVTQSIAQERADADGALDATIFAFAGFGDAEVDRIIPVRPFLFQARDEQPVTLDHHLGVGRLHRELEVVEVVFARDVGELQRALHHAERRVTEAVHNAVGQRTVVRADADGALEPDALQHEGRELFFDALQLKGVLRVGVFLDRKFFGVGVVAGIHAHDFHPLHRFHRGFGFEMDVRHDRHMAAALAEFSDNVLQVRRVLHRRRGDAHDLATHRDEVKRLLDGRSRVHRVARNHGLRDDRMRAADDDAAVLRIADDNLAGLAALVKIG